MSRVPYLDLRLRDESEIAEIMARIETVLRDGPFLGSPLVDEFEGRVAQRLGRRFGIGVGSGTDALILGLRALGIGPGDEVILPPLSFVATANAVTLAGACPVFADIDSSLCLDPDSIAPLITERVRAIMPVHWAGKMCRMDAIMPIAKRHGLLVIEDAAQAFGALRHGMAAGGVGNLGCFSMNVMKVLAAVGEAGMVVTDDETVAERLRHLRYHGMVDKEFCVEPSHNARLDAIQAAALLARLSRLDRSIARRRDNAAFYASALSEVVDVPREEEGCRDVYFSYGVGTDRRDDLLAFLAGRGIEAKLPHRLLMPEQKPHSACRGAFKRARDLHARQLLLPVSDALTDDQRQRVAEAVLAFFGRAP